DESDDALDDDENWRNREQCVVRECRSQASRTIGRPLVEGVEKERSQVTRLERAKPAHLPDDVEWVLGIGLRRVVAGHGDFPAGNGGREVQAVYRRVADELWLVCLVPS